MRRRAFTLVEILIVLIIFGIVMGAVFSALAMYFSSQWQTEDYAIARAEIEGAFGALSSPFSSIGLGLPNNAAGSGAFAASFAAVGSQPNASVMSSMGAWGSAWGGPVTVASGDVRQPAGRITAPDADGYYCGPELYFAWSVPLGRVISPDVAGSGGADKMKQPTGSYESWINFQQLSMDVGYWSGQRLALRGADGGVLPVSQDQWVTLPSFGLPLYVERLEGGGSRAVVKIAPGAEAAHILLGSPLRGFEELHAVRASRLRVVNEELIQEFYVMPPQLEPDVLQGGGTHRVLARNVAGVWFRFNPRTRILQMALAVQGINADRQGAAPLRPAGWPDGAPDIGGKDRRILVENRAWRIRN